MAHQGGHLTVMSLLSGTYGNNGRHCCEDNKINPLYNLLDHFRLSQLIAFIFYFLKMTFICLIEDYMFTLSGGAVDIESSVSSAQRLQLFLPLLHLPALTVVMISVLDSIFIITNIFPQP